MFNHLNTIQEVLDEEQRIIQSADFLSQYAYWDIKNFAAQRILEIAKLLHKEVA